MVIFAKVNDVEGEGTSKNKWLYPTVNIGVNDAILYLFYMK